MMDNIGVYVSALQESLQKKLDVLLELLKLTKEQGAILKEKEPDMDRFDEIIQEKAKLLDTLKNNKYAYQTQITEMQNLIRSITDTGVQIEGQEHRNKTAFQQYLTGARHEIKEFTVNNHVANSYYHNMANQHQSWQSYFLDQKK